MVLESLLDSDFLRMIFFFSPSTQNGRWSHRQRKAS